MNKRYQIIGGVSLIILIVAIIAVVAFGGDDSEQVAGTAAEAITYERLNDSDVVAQINAERSRNIVIDNTLEGYAESWANSGENSYAVPNTDYIIYNPQYLSFTLEYGVFENSKSLEDQVVNEILDWAPALNSQFLVIGIGEDDSGNSFEGKVFYTVIVGSWGGEPTPGPSN